MKGNKGFPNFSCFTKLDSLLFTTNRKTFIYNKNLITAV